MAGRKRPPDQIKAERAVIAELHYQRFSDAEIATWLQVNRGTVLSRRQVNYEINQIRKQWLAKQHESYDAMVADELNRLDELERKLWQELRQSSGDKVRKTIERVARQARTETLDQDYGGQWSREEGEKYDLFTARILETSEFQQANPIYFDKIMRVQEERRKLLGLYPRTSDRSSVQINVIKSYHASVSPDLWPDAIVDGEVVASEEESEEKLLSDGLHSSIDPASDGRNLPAN